MLLINFECYAWKGNVALVADPGINLLVEEIFKVEGEELTIFRNQFTRSLTEVVKGDKDFHFPIIKTKETESRLTLSTETPYHIIFYLFYNRSRPIRKKDLNRNKLKIDTELSHIDSFSFLVNGVTCIECSIKKLNAGRIDGVLFPRFLVEKIIKENNLKNLNSFPYKKFEVKFVLSPKADISKLNKIISNGIKKLRKSKKLEKILQVKD